MRVAIESFIFNFLFLCAVITLDIINIESGRVDSMTTLTTINKSPKMNFAVIKSDLDHDVTHNNAPFNL